MLLSRHAAWRAAAALALLLTHANALADDVADARGHFADGVRRFGDGDFEGARRLFLQAEHEHHAPVILYNLARAEERLGHPQAAVDAYERYLAEAGAKAEFAEPAAIAVADLRARSGRVRIESKPQGGRAFVDGNPLEEPTPTSVLLPAGLHHVVVEGETWRASSDFEATGGHDLTVRVERPETAALPIVAPPPLVLPPPKAPALPRNEGPEGFVYGASFVVAPFVFFGAVSPTKFTHPAGSGGSSLTTDNSTWQWGFEAAISAEAGYAFAPRAEILLRGFAGLGSTCKNVLASHIVAGGPAISYRLTDSIWIGASAIGGNGATCRGQSEFANYNTGLVLSPSVDLAIAVVTNSYGQWIITASVANFFADAKNNILLYVPLGFGVRFF
jgi:PEGA domain-containing protein